MSAFNFVWDLHQSGQLSDMDKRVEDLEKKVEILKEWVDYLQQQLEQKNGNNQKDIE
jgi:chaperonin cofactor prefoldin